MSVLPKSLSKVCVALGFPSPEQLTHAADLEYKDGNTLLEFRLDYLQHPLRAPELIANFLLQHPDVQIVATCRHEGHHGHFRGTVEQQLKILGLAAGAGAIAVDLEIESAERLKPGVEALRRQTSVIVSYHNFQNTPALNPVMNRLSRVPADAYKIATHANKPTDALRLMDFLKTQPAIPLVAFAMSEQGFCTRVLSPGYGGLFTFASPIGAQGTAPGQVPAHALKALYRTDKITRQTKIYGVIADPVAHSKSPQIHNRAFQSRRVDAIYLPFRVLQSQLGDWMKVAASMPVTGFSVTIPHKQKILRYIDHVEPLAKRIGAVNTVWRKAGKWRGVNTDVEGVLKPLSRRLRLAHAQVLLVGYGGAARAAAFALKDAGANVTLTGRDLIRGTLLAKAIGTKCISLSQAEASQFDVLVHATPVGMHPKPDACLFANRVPAGVVFDMVYNPRETALVKRAKELGREVIPGTEMFLEQAAAQFEIWTGETAPRAVMQHVLENGD
jgi:3-dehydroquinate dehydratase / shikimate dehydrogenase